MIPRNAIGVLSSQNANPGQYRYSDSTSWIGTVNIINDSNMEVLQDRAHNHGTNAYLGMIVSEDRETVYWVNTTKPLP